MSKALELAATAAVVGGVPGFCHCPTADAVEMADYCGSAFAIEGPVVAGILRRSAVWIGSSQDVVLIRRVADAVDGAFKFSDGVGFSQ